MDFSTVDPASGRTLESFAYMSLVEVGARLDGAQAAASMWRETSVAKRAELLHEVARRLRAEREGLAATATREMGKPITQARAEVEKCATCCDWFAENAERLLADQPAPSAASRSYVAFRPLGVVLAIIPWWNYPYWQVFRAAAPALMAGNAMVLKHAESTTRCALEIERIFRDAGAPADLFATILYSNEDTDALIADPRITAVTLTGSERAGIAVGSAAGAALKPCVLELGGSDAFVVRADADLDATAKAATTARFQNNGQSCIAGKRFIVVDAVYDAFLERFAAKPPSRSIVSDPADDTCSSSLGASRASIFARRAPRSRSRERRCHLRVPGDRWHRSARGAGSFCVTTIVADVVPGTAHVR